MRFAPREQPPGEQPPGSGSRRRVRVRIAGVVQGVGFRPFVRRLATRHRLTGFVGNDDLGVFIEAEGGALDVSRFLDALTTDAPVLARIDHVHVDTVEPCGERAFDIVASATTGDRRALIAPDVATCAACRRELFDPSDRRHRYPFVNCTDCGPRFTIVRDVPYDRANTTMAAFAMCPACRSEYEDPDDRRYHAEPVCCPACGPSLWFERPTGTRIDGDAVALAVGALRAGDVVAVKGLGAYHLAARAADEQAVARLRRAKHREERPFALMVPDVDAARRLCDLTPDDERLLADPSAPIVLCRRRRDAAVAPSVAPRNRSLGLMLPYTPLHHLVMHDLGEPIVLTSGNVSDEPVAFEDYDARDRLAALCDAFLTHDRPIHMRTDDSVARAVAGRPLLVRRARGYVPLPMRLPLEATRPVLACGGELKNTFCVVRRDEAFLSHHIGDLENYPTFRAFTDGIASFCRLLDVEPAVVAHDLHPEYLSTKHALTVPGVELVGVQHHHAHIASCLADNGERGPVIGIAFDGLGYGCDRTLWGGEVLIADLATCRRVGCLTPVRMPGGTAAIRQPWRMAAAYVDRLGGAMPEAVRDLAVRHGDRWGQVVALARRGVGSPVTSSAGRLFDAVAALLDVRDAITYEGQAAIELEQLADPSERGSYPVRVMHPDRDGLTDEEDDAVAFLLDGVGLVGRVIEDRAGGTERGIVAARFHNAVADLVTLAVAAALEHPAADGCDAVALSGGVFQNALLVERVLDRLHQAGHRVLTHHRVPPNDGGLSLGQAAVAAARTAG